MTLITPVRVAACAALLLSVVVSAHAAEKRALPDAAKRQVDFSTDIKPILIKHCVRCHSGPKKEGSFSVDHLHSFLLGGESGEAVLKGKSAKSLLIELVLGNDKDTAMPQKGAPVSLPEIALLRAWIDQGVSWEKGFTFAKFPRAKLAPRVVKLPPAAGPKASPNPIDRLLAGYLAKQKIKSAAVVDDRTFLRRVSLDVIGLLPTAKQVEQFIADKNPRKREAIVDKLLADNKNYAEHWITFWNDALRNSYSRQYHGGGGKPITGWLTGALSKNMPYDQFVRELITQARGSAGFIQGVRWRGTVNASQVPEMQAAQNVAQVFLGLNLKCASCHDSFINHWSLRDAYALASTFANGPLEMHKCNKGTGKVVPSAFLYPELGAIDAKAAKNVRQQQLAKLITHEKNGRFPRTVVNRLWAVFFGRGLVEPVDEMDLPPWSADLLDWMAVDTVSHKYDLKHTMRQILTSRAYQMASVEARKDEQGNDYVFRGPLVRRMSAEQLLDAIEQVVLLGKAADQRPSWKRAGTRKLDPLMVALGRPKRDQVVTRRESVATTLQTLELTNGDRLAALLQRGGPIWSADKKQTPEAVVDRLFREALGRAPTPKERMTALQAIGTPVSPRGVEDLLWMMAMLPEFQLIY